jgi:uncharacterized membrane protein
MNKTETKEITEKQEKSGGKGLKIVKTIFNVIINVLIVAVLIISIVVATLALTSKANPNGLPNIFGYTLQYVQTNSMDTPSPDGYEGGNFSDKDVIIGKVYDIDNPVELNVGDIITFNSHRQDEEGKDRLITHRIVDKQKASDGSNVYQTWGDNRDVAQVPDQSTVEDYLHESDIIAINYTSDYHGKVLSGWADFMRTLRSPGGFFGIVLIPMIIFFLYAIVRVVISAMNYKKGKVDDLKEEAEKEKQEAVQAAVAAALAEKEKQSAEPQAVPDAVSANAPSNAPAEMTAEQMEQFKQFLAFQEAQKAAQAQEEKPEEE